ncbi:glycosyltransferase [Enterovibrio norvegicus FF-454]|uniref:Glycosyltransferase n=1 Tax=Enterovibrio norvegicus FF-454 TaxID=1185651 RepID=A0A1E5C022_9GAMM|nr:glycosyltransferase family 2 protein [Enterovibrio norvegicus]OEE58781.1 glycosyltransferase [Enterovibrio norvegicus FF-454]
MRFIVSVVSHGHEKMIVNFGTLKLLSSLDDVIVICRDNKPSSLLRKHCEKHDIHYIKNKVCKGFAENNNLNFNHYLTEFGRVSGDVFLLVNPDIILTKSAFGKFAEGVKRSPNSIVTANLFLDADHSVQDHNIRRYPSLFDFVSSYVFRKNKTIINRSNHCLPSDGKFWSSGAFMGVSVENFLKVRGFDESYYMYCEDIDFCRRAALHDIHVTMALDSCIVHTRSRDSQKLLSKYFYWHVSGVMKYMLRKESRLPKKSSLCVLDNEVSEHSHELAG